jgi:hypothetical protein
MNIYVDEPYIDGMCNVVEVIVVEEEQVFSIPSTNDWTLVRRTSSANNWHPATDSLYGTDEYGTPCFAW